MRPQTGQFVRFDFHTSPGLGRGQGSMSTRECLVVDSGDDGFHCSPVTFQPPRGDDRKYAVPLTTGMRKQLGFGDKPAWLMTNQVNYARHGSPALRPVQRANSMPQHSQGTASREFLTEVWQARRQASKDQRIEIREPAFDAQLVRQEPARIMPGQSRNTQARTSTLRGIAARLLGERQAEAAAAAPRAAESGRGHSGPIDLSI